jgi:hypothetical protein
MTAATLEKCNDCAFWSTNALGQLVTPSGQFTGCPQNQPLWILDWLKRKLQEMDFVRVESASGPMPITGFRSSPETSGPVEELFKSQGCKAGRQGGIDDDY